jgi:hypothetical protein
MIGYEENIRVGLQQNLAIQQIRTEDKTFAALVHARQQLASYLDGRCSVGCGVLDARKSTGNPAYLLERDGTPLEVYWTLAATRHLLPHGHFAFIELNVSPLPTATL